MLFGFKTPPSQSSQFAEFIENREDELEVITAAAKEVQRMDRERVRLLTDEST